MVVTWKYHSPVNRPPPSNLPIETLVARRLQTNVYVYIVQTLYMYIPCTYETLIHVHTLYMHAIIYRDIYSMYMDMYDSTFIGKQLNNLQKVKDFYTEQVSTICTCMSGHI